METMILSYLIVCLPVRPFPGTSDFTLCRIFVKFSAGFLNRKLSLRSEFCINRLSDRNAFLTTANEILPVLPLFLDHFLLHSV
jgi:hypothetical protein